MKLPTMIELETSRSMIDAFGGYNHNLRIGENEFYDMENLTSTHYPILSPRGKRGIYTHPDNPQGLIAKDTLCYVDGENFVINQYPVNMRLSTDPEMCPKRLISMGAYVIILPDAKWINTAKWDGSTFDENDGWGSINEKFESEGKNVTFTLARIDSEEYAIDFPQSGEPDVNQKDEAGNSVVKNGSLWLDTSSSPHTLKQFSQTSGMWVSIATTYIKIQCAGIGKGFEQYDGVTISGLKDVELKSSVLDDDGKNIIIDGNSKEQMSAIDGSFVIWDKGDDYITVIGLLDTTQTIINEITVERKMPAMDFVTESENRLWGCRYGVSNNGEVVNEIYACKLGDFKNWNCFMGLSTDSYVAGCGTDGVFTGAITHLGYPLFFKENFLHKVYGNFPSNYQIQTTACRGVQRGCHDSLAIVNEILYYKARSGICAYDGSLPAEMSSALGDVAYSNAVAGSHGNKYFISMMDNGGDYHFFVYDAVKGMWHREDDTHVDCFCSCRNEMYFVDNEDKAIKTVYGSGTPESAEVEWMAETGVIGASMPDKKYISRINVRLALDIGSKVYIYAQYDSIGDWEPLYVMTGTVLRSFTVPIRPKRCDHMRIRIVGEGDAKIYSITKTIEQGSDI